MLDRLQSLMRPEALIGCAAALLLTALLAGVLYVLKPSLGTYRELGRAHSGALLELATEGENTDPAAIAALEEGVKRIRDRLYGGSSGVPLQEMEAFVIDALDRISARHDVELTSVTPGRMTDVLMFGELPYDVRVAGTYFHLFDWLQDVEAELRPMVVKQFEMARPEGADTVDLELRLVAYRSEGSAS